MDISLNRTSIDTLGESLHHPYYSMNLAEHGEILAVHYSPYEWSQDIMLIVFSNKILVLQLDHQVRTNF